MKLPSLLTVQGMKLPVPLTIQAVSNEITIITKTATTRSNDTYVYGVGILAVLAIGVCVFFAYKNSQAKNQKTTNEDKQDQPPTRRPML